MQEVIRRWAWPMLLLLLVTWAGGMGYKLARSPRGYAHVWVYPQGDGLLLLDPREHTVLVDGPSDSIAFQTWVGFRMPLGVWNVDLVVLTRWEENITATQATLLRRIPPRRAWAPFPTENPAALAEWLRVCGEPEFLEPGLEGNVGRWFVRVLSGTPPIITFTYGHFQLLYAPQGIPAEQKENTAKATLVLTSHWTDGIADPPYLYLSRRAKESPELLQHPTVRLLLPPKPDSTLHLTTDGEHLGLEWER